VKCVLAYEHGLAPLSAVIARLDRATQYALTLLVNQRRTRRIASSAATNRRRTGILGRPVKPGDDGEPSMRLVPIIRCAGVDLQRQRQQHRGERRVLHHVLDHRQRRRYFVVGHLEDQFVVNL
jgi:hypothetical protein